MKLGYELKISAQDDNESTSKFDSHKNNYENDTQFVFTPHYIKNASYCLTNKFFLL